ncbi:hypothetical protein JDV09_23645 [Mycobacterium sp. Y57]|uniref:alpha/beta hydrolase family protein n=1 Tax=Mycolicibacterium xanthum TaxID=2796469 RepID=UPI001C8505E7|nr:hypothetical protein [Mycolicibacterium xanthum]MBX7435068.1 hypothetical protein [Mycolicibacterium xanthum]
MALPETPDDGRQEADASGSSPGGTNPLAHVVGPFARSGRFYAQAWTRYLGGESTDLPVVRPSPMLAGHALLDEVVVTAFRMFRRFPEPEVFEAVEREVATAIEFYDRKGWLDDPRGFFAAPPPLEEVTVRTAGKGKRTHERISFASGYAPLPDEPGGERWSSYTGNEREYALVLRHDEPRPWVVCIHGSEMGRADIDLRLFRAWHLHENLGLNVALPVLPMHGPRKRGLPKGVSFPSENLVDNAHATAQAVWDVRRLLSWIRSQDPDAPIGLNSMSLGAYVTSLVASLEDGLACAILGVPVIDLVKVFEYHAGFAEDDPRLQMLVRAEPLGRMMSPISLTPRVPMEGRFVYAGIADHIVQPRSHAVRIWEHWGKPEIAWYHGGHAGFFRAKAVHQFIDDALVQSGLVHGSAVDI